MPTTFTTYYGSSFHGIFVEWTHTLATPLTLQAKMTLNWYANLQEIGDSTGIDNPALPVDTTGWNGGVYSTEVDNMFSMGLIFNDPLCTSEAGVAPICYDGMRGNLSLKIDNGSGAAAVAPAFWTIVYAFNKIDPTTATVDLTPDGPESYETPDASDNGVTPVANSA